MHESMTCQLPLEGLQAVAGATATYCCCCCCLSVHCNKQVAPCKHWCVVCCISEVIEIGVVALII